MGLSGREVFVPQSYEPGQEGQVDWFVFPKMRSSRGVDPTRSIGSFRKAWETIRKKVGVTARFFDWRHATITELLECGVPEQVIENTVGHVDPQVKKRCSHVRKQAPLDAARRLQERRKSLEVVQDLVQHAESLPIQ
jgi:intergrase/recombinase